MKKFIAIVTFATISIAATAQTQSNQTATASQTVKLVLSNAIEITFTGNSSATGADVNIPFTSVNDYANGVESAEQELKVRSNKDFYVRVKTGSNKFSYTGNTTPAPQMPVKNVLNLKVTANNTGGSIASPFSSNNYATLKNNSQSLLTNCDRGGDQTFKIKYKATPGFAYPAGTYSVDVIYTATQQ